MKDLLGIISRLRGPDGCPWDKAQTHQSLAPFAVEETFEMVDAIETRADAHLKEELGDVLFQVVLHAEIAKERGAFSISDIIENLNRKLIKRHPHVFGDANLQTPEEVKKNWEAMKAKEAAPEASPFASIPKGLPALQRSQKIGHRSIRYNFDWNDVRFVMEKVEEELAEVKDAMKKPQDRESLALEIGDLLFTVTQLGKTFGHRCRASFARDESKIRD
jgi:tetrapyrrole methylase family protein / MazG family protein